MRLIPLFKGLTRPPMIFGVLIVPLFTAMGVIFLLSFYTQNIFMVIFSDEANDKKKMILEKFF